MGVVVFDPAAFKVTYPEFGAVADDTLQAKFNLTPVYLNNTDSSLVSDPVQRAILLNMLVAHLCALSGLNASGGAGAAQAGMVGRITSATEGTVSVSSDFDNGQPSSAWFTQTQYGAMYWQAIAPYKTMHYMPGRSNAPNQQTCWPFISGRVWPLQ